ncbi:hypothetical protein RhiXN_10240 [Rhizoctonia solani]|uniref:LYC1 C-terminal domain-containing protein n=1 Tax=Rhizoctonia solani TaxID=456999 RepID=A0A8H8P4S7_9AGAM|nr:uncharacterized protein RhiXN_10240 [Rhizoctonia solani]QRW23916.1 hypothetical protein RhiXN_10240 [Rhizoctonia solani]
MSLEDLIVRLANEAQFHEATRRDALYWAGRSGLSVEDYVTLDELLLHGAFEREGKLHIWVFVPKDNPETTDFYASCETLAREVITLQPGQSEPSSSYGHSITSVIVPPEHRRKGYAERFMSLLHSALVPHRYPDPLNTPVTFKQPSTVSVLYSVVGNYYARCVPAARESGWSIQKSFVTTWPLSNVHISQTTSSPVESLSDTEIISALDLDDSNIPGDMLKMQKQDPEKTYFAFVPTAPLNDYSVVISKLVQLVITRLRATPDLFPTLLAAAVQTAKDTGCESIEIWNVPEDLKMIALKTGGETTERTDDLAAFKWYGQNSDPKIDNKDDMGSRRKI